MTENTFFFLMLPWGRSQVPGEDRCAGPSLRGLHTPSHSFPSISFPLCWFYALHSLTAKQQRLCSIPHHHGCVQGRRMGKKGSQGKWKTGIPQNYSSSPPAQERVHVPRGQTGSQPHWPFPQDESAEAVGLSLLTRSLLACTLAAWHPEKETESKHSGFWGTDLGMREMPFAPLVQESKCLPSPHTKPHRALSGSTVHRR